MLLIVHFPAVVYVPFQGGPSAKGLTDKRDYNAFLVSVDPADKLASMVFRVASGTQVRSTLVFKQA